MKIAKLLLFFLFISSVKLVNAQDNALTFNSSATYAQIANSAAINPSSITIEAWINATAWRANYWEGSIVNKECDGCPDAGYMLRAGNGGTLNFGISVGAGWTELSSAAGAMVTGTWYHVAGVYDGANMYLFINGAQVASKAQTGSITSNATPLEIGRMNGDINRYFSGKIDEVRIWNTGLNAGVISSWYNKTVTACHPKYANLVGYYECNNTTAGVLTATVGANGTVSGATYGASGNASFLGLISGFQSTTSTQLNTTNVTPGSTNNEVIRIEVETYSAMNATQFVLRTNGTTNVADIANAKLWYTGTSSTFATTTQFGATIAVPPAAGVDMTFAGTQALSCGKNYFWLTYDVTAGATLGNVIDATYQSSIVNAIARVPVTTAPAGSRPIANSCVHTIRLTDTFGDGWNGGTVTVTVNGVPVLTNITLTAGAGPQDFTFNANTGDAINVTCTAAGSFPTEMRVEVFGGGGAVILAQQQPALTPGTNFVGSCPSPMTFVSCTTTQANVSSLSPGAVTQEIIGIQIVTSGASAPLSASQFTVNANGSTNINDINAANSAKIYYTGTSSTFATTTLFGQNTPTIANFTINGAQTLSAGTNYFWLVYDIKPGATIGDVVDGQCTSLNVSVARTPTVTAPAGNRPITSSCSHIARLTDTFGDGWNGGTVTISVNGVPVLTNITLAAGAGPQDFTFNANGGDVINFTQTAAGSFPTEMRVEIITGTGSSAIAPTQPLVAPGTSTNGCCVAVVPGLATNPTPANGSVAISPCSLDFSWTAPANTGCNGATSYDMYFGTVPAPPFLINRTTTTYAIPNALADNTTYYWKIVPKNGAGSAAACPTWSFTTGASSNPLFCMYGNSTNYPLGGANCAQLTPNLGTQNGCVWNRAQVSFASAFDYTVNMYFGASAGGADGAAFVFQNSPIGISQCGSNGGQLGAGGISNAVVIEFDTYDNDWPGHIYDMAVDHTAIEIDGDMQGPGAPLAGPVQADPLDGLIADGLIHIIRITWNPATQIMCVYVDGSLRLSTSYDFVNNVFGGNPNVWWGLTGSTGALANQQYFCPTLIPLPIELSNFDLNCEKEFVEITWTTISEKNNDYFTVERSKDSEDWKVLDNIKGAGNSNDILNYKIIDSNPQIGGSYYRLRQTDFDGTVSYSDVRYINCIKSESEIFIYPNPCGEIINVKIQNDFLNSETIVSITDIVGKVLIEKTTKNRLISFDLSNFSNGIYFVHLRSNSIVEIRKFVKK